MNFTELIYLIKIICSTKRDIYQLRDFTFSTRGCFVRNWKLPFEFVDPACSFDRTGREMTHLALAPAINEGVDNTF